jgi:molybdopterin-guanine dinucleotide biosynthesis protein A
MAGGRNTRYGAIKALEPVGGVRIIDRVIHALQEVTPDIVLIANEPQAYASVGLPMRGDVRPDAAALGGLLTALLWAKEVGRGGALAVACDMPFLSVDLLRDLLRRAQEPDIDVVAPESGSRRGLEPLCAWYSTRCVPAVEAAIDRDDLRLIASHDHVQVRRIPLEEVQKHGDPELLFLNVNTREERERAERVLAEQA